MNIHLPAPFSWPGPAATVLAFGAAAACLASRVNGATLLINAARDGVLYEESTGASANGAGDYLLAGRTNQSSGSRRRSLLFFDLTGLPSGAIIMSATVQLQAVPVATTSEMLSLHRVLASWTTATSDPAGNESAGVAALTGDTSWLYASFPSTLWAVPGGDHATTPSASLAAGPSGGEMLWTSPSMAADVQAWGADPASNHGWMLRSGETIPQTAKRFDSASGLDPALRPVLMIEYGIIPEPECSVTALVGLGWLLQLRRRSTSSLVP